MTDRADVVIVGGGVMGSATAFFLCSMASFGGSVVVVERDPTYRFATSSLSASSIRQQFSTPLNIHMSLFGIDFLRDIRRHLAIDGEDVSIGLHEHGYLILATPANEALLRQNIGLQRREGGDIIGLDAVGLRERFPWLVPDGAALGAFGVSGEGSFDGPALMQAFRRKAISLGARYVTGNVTAIERAGARITGVRLADGSRLACGALVNAAGPQAGDVAALAGVALPVRPRKRSVFVFRTPAALPGYPLLIDTNGVWCRRERDVFICGVSPAEHEDVDATDFEVDHELFDDPIWPTIAARAPALETLKVVGGWAGHYEVNTLDHNAIIGPHPEIANLLFINGFSGHGMQQSPAAGRAVAEWIAQGRYVSLDMSLFGYERIRDRRPVRELNVI